MNHKSSEPANGQSLPWYRYGMVWMVIALPLIVVVASMVTMSIAFNNPPQLMSEGKLDKGEINVSSGKAKAVHTEDQSR